MYFKLSKLCLGMMIIYSLYIQVVFKSIDNLAAGLGMLTALFLLIAIYKDSVPLTNGITIEIFLWTAFALTSLFTGYFVSSHPTNVISSVLMFIQYLIMITVVCFISKYDGNIDFIISVSVITAVICAITTVLWGQPYLGGNQISMTAQTNPNDLAVFLVFGIFCLLYRLDTDDSFNVLLTATGTVLFLYAIILTASRKSLLAAGLFLLYWLLLVFGRIVRQKALYRKVLTVITMASLITALVYFATPILVDSVIYQRLTSISAGDELRLGMYKDAMGFFMASPLFGIGFDNFRLLSSYTTYSHSTYAEILACTGLVGAVLYFGAYVTMACKSFRIIIDVSMPSIIRTQSIIILGMLIVMVALATGVIHFYDFVGSLVFAVIISFNLVNAKRVG